MSLFLEVTSLIKPANNLLFPIADTTDLIGGFMLVNSLSDIDARKIREGMLCYVIPQNLMYQYKNQSWVKFLSDIFHLYLNLNLGEITEELFNAVKNSEIVSVNDHIVSYKFIDDPYIELHYCDLDVLYRCLISNDGSISYNIIKYDMASVLTKGLIAPITGNRPDLLMSQKIITEELNKKQNILTAGTGIYINKDTIHSTLDLSLFIIVPELPERGQPHKIYLVQELSDSGNIYAEYAYIIHSEGDEFGTWEKLGEYKSEIDLELYALKTDIPSKVSELDNDSNYVHTVNNKQSTDGTVTINGEDINVPFYAVNDSGELEFHELTVSELATSFADSLAILALYLLDIFDNKANTSDIPTKVSQLENDTNFITKEAIPESETYVLNFTISDGVNTGEYPSDEYTKLLAAVKSGKLVIVKGGATRVTADSLAIADKDAYVVIRYSTPRISDDNTSITMSFYELKFGAIDSSGICKYQSKAIHKTI